MKGFVISLLASVIATPGATLHSPVALSHASAQPLRVTDWLLTAELRQACESQVNGEVTEAAGAALELQCAADAKVLGNVSAVVDVRGWQQRRVTLSAEVHAGEAMNGSLWLKTRHGKTTLMFEDDTEQALVTATDTDDGWVRRTVTLPIPVDATHISFGVLLQGSGQISLRNVQLSVSEPGAIAPEAARFLDATIAIIKHQTQWRQDLPWRMLEPQTRLFASGAQRSADTYPAIRYLLYQLADKRSLLLAPEVAAALAHHDNVPSAANLPVSIFALPDGARLVLSNMPAEFAVRTVQNRSATTALP